MDFREAKRHRSEASSGDSDAGEASKAIVASPT
jgi:hypothetical protein